MEVPVLKIAQNSSSYSKVYVLHAMKTVSNVLAAQKTNVRLVGMISIFITVPVMILAQPDTTLMLTTGDVKYVMNAVRNVQIRHLLVALRVNKTSISNLNLITQRVLQLAQRDTTLMIIATYVNHAMKIAKHVLAAQQTNVSLVWIITIIMM